MFDYGMTPAAVPQSDTQAIALALRRGDVAFLHSLVEQYHYRLTRYLIYLLGKREGVDDLVQETWLRVMERGSSYDGRSRFEPWLFAVARHLAIDDLRRRRMPSLDADEDDSGEASLAPPASTAASPFVLAARSEDAARLAQALQVLDPMVRETLVLRFQEELSLQEISTLVGAPVSTVASRIYRGLAALRTQLEGATRAL
jgi:RNA polymerase sigma-70 factor (ECF subfamily)